MRIPVALPPSRVCRQQNGWRNGRLPASFEKRKGRLVIGLDSVYFVVPFSRRAGNDSLALSLREIWEEKHFVMSVKIRLKRVGSRNRPVFRVVAADSRSPRDGRFIEELGTYHPAKTSNKVAQDMARSDRRLVFSVGKKEQKGKKARGWVAMDMSRVEYWLGVGAQPSDTVQSFIRAAERASKAAAAAVESSPRAS